MLEKAEDMSTLLTGGRKTAERGDKMANGVTIHPTALVDPTAELASGVRVGPYSIIGPHVRLGEDTVVESHVIIDTWTTIGRECHIWPGAKLGGPPQDRKY